MSVVVPFRGGVTDARELVGSLEAVRLSPGDELIVADNTREGLVERVASASPVIVVPARAEQSSYHARNVGADRAASEWLLYIDADCRPTATVLDDYFKEPVPAECGGVIGAVLSAGDQDALVSRYARSRQHVSQSPHVEHAYRPFGATANLLVRRAAWAGVGGFLEGVRSGADADFCWRLQHAGWSLEYRRTAVVEHIHRTRLVPMVRQAGRYSAARVWLNRRYPGSFRRPTLMRPLARCVAGVVVWTLTGRFERALFKAMDATWLAAEASAQFLSNRAPELPGQRLDAREDQPGDRGLAVFTDAFPVLSETFVTNEVRAIKAAGRRVRVEASARPMRPERSAWRELPTAYIEDEGIARKLFDYGWLLGRHPLRCLDDYRARGRWLAEEPVWPLHALASSARRVARARDGHLHAHFAAGAALNALRVSRLLGLPFSVTAHAYDIYMQPRNLREKLTAAAVSTSGCDYTVEYLRSLVPPADAERIHKVVMGIDGERFRRRTPYPDTRNVITVGRLVEKKGFRHLLDAAARLQTSSPLERLTIVGDGPLKASLADQARRLGVHDSVVFTGARQHSEIRGLLEQASVLAMPSVIASDGDRDSMPVVVKEALAMEIPVIASDEVGLPELVQDDWGRLVPPGDDEALAAAIDRLLRLPYATRVAMGRAGRDWVLKTCDLNRETAKLLRLIDQSADSTRDDRRDVCQHHGHAGWRALRP